MAQGVQAPKFPKVLYKTGARLERGEREKSEVEILENDADYASVGMKDTGGHAHMTLSAFRAVERRRSRVLPMALGLFLLLALTATAARYISVTVQRDKLSRKHEELKSQYENLSNFYNLLLQEQCQETSVELESQTDTPSTTYNLGLKTLDTTYSSLEENPDGTKRPNETENETSCPKGWLKVGCSCYYEFSESQSLEESKAECLSRGGNLLVVNSRDKQKILGGETAEAAGDRCN
ncbi:uncharacterized protein KZ484_007003 isoform 2-T2 [Pholidichthys leucotaenia]